MSGPVRSLCLIALVSLGGVAAAFAPAHALDDSKIAQALPSPRAAIPVPSDRRPGELEGTPRDDKNAKAAAKPAGKSAGKKSDAHADKKTGQAAADKARDDGGLPLPRERGDDRSAPVGFDANGKLGTGFKF